MIPLIWQRLYDVICVRILALYHYAQMIGICFLQNIIFSGAIVRIIWCDYLGVGNANYTRGLSFLPEVSYTLPL